MLNGNKRKSDRRLNNKSSGLYDPIARTARHLVTKKRERELLAASRRELATD